MRILMAGFSDPLRFAGMKGLEFAPLIQADEPTEYDFVFLRPSLVGGIFAPQELAGLLDPTGTAVWPNRWQDARAMHAWLTHIGERLVVLGQMHGLVVIPCATEMIRYHEPRTLNPTVAQINQTFGRGMDNFIEHRFFNLDVLGHWKLIAVHSGESGRVVRRNPATGTGSKRPLKTAETGRGFRVKAAGRRKDERGWRRRRR